MIFLFREPQSDVGPAAMFVGNIVQGVRMAAAEGRSLGPEGELVRIRDLICFHFVCVNMFQHIHVNPFHLSVIHYNDGCSWFVT